MESGPRRAKWHEPHNTQSIMFAALQHVPFVSTDWLHSTSFAATRYYFHFDFLVNSIVGQQQQQQQPQHKLMWFSYTEPRTRSDWFVRYACTARTASMLKKPVLIFFSLSIRFSGEDLVSKPPIKVQENDESSSRTTRIRWWHAIGCTKSRFVGFYVLSTIYE